MALPYLPTAAAINTGGPVDQVWIQYFLEELGVLTSLNTIVNAIPGVNVFTVATQPSLGPADAGYLGLLTDYDHAIRWTGATWTFFADDNAYFEDRVIAPQGVGWQLCDGTVTKYLTLGAILTETSFTTPNLIGTPAYRKAAAAYTGTINAASGTTGTANTGDTAPGVTGNSDDASPGVTGSTDSESAHTHGPGTFATGNFQFSAGQAQAGVTAGFTSPSTTQSQAITGTSGSGSAHSHGTSAITVNSHHHGTSAITVNAHHHPVPALGVGTLDMVNLGALPYFRR